MSDDTETTVEATPEPAQPTPYEMVGGAEGLHRIVDRFCEIMDQDPSVATIRAMHGTDLGPIREKLFDFLSGWLGGPPHFISSAPITSACIRPIHPTPSVKRNATSGYRACTALWRMPASRRKPANC